MAGGKRGPYKKSAERRGAILAAALEAYAESDAGGPTLQAIADKAGLTQTALLYYFPSREDLFLAIVQARDEQDRFRPLDETLTAEDFRRLGDMVAHNSDTPGLVRLFLEQAVASAAGDSHVAHTYFKQRYAAFRRTLAEGLQAARGVPADQAEWLARVLIAAADGLQLQWLYNPDFSMRRDLGRLVDLAIAVTTQPPATCESSPKPESQPQAPAA